MLTLIKKDVYEETLALIDGTKKPDPVLKGMQEFYASYGIVLYNLFLNDMFGKTRISALTNVPEGYTGMRMGLENFNEDSLREYERLCKLHGKEIMGLANFDNPENLVLGTGYYFDRIWKIEIIGRAGVEIRKELENLLSDIKDNHMIVNSGLGVVTVFEDTPLDEQTKAQIISLSKDILRRYDPRNICRAEKVIVFDTLQNLNQNFGGNLYYYYK